jgi:hypothetical protein
MIFKKNLGLGLESETLTLTLALTISLCNIYFAKNYIQIFYIYMFREPYKYILKKVLNLYPSLGSEKKFGFFWSPTNPNPNHTV